MPHKIEDYIITITTFEFKMFDQLTTDYLYDVTPQQAADSIWKDKCSSAVFSKMTVFNIMTGHITHINLKNLVNDYESGTEEDLNILTKRLSETINKFKTKHKLE